MKSVFLILFNITTQIKWISETIQLSVFNKDYLNQIQYQGFYSQIPFSRAIGAIAENQLIINSCSFIDEFEKELIPSRFPKYSERIIKFKKIIKPALSRIKKWNGLRDARNHIVAHNLRIKGISVFESQKIIKYNVPSTDEEYILLADLIFLISENVKEVFPEIVQEIDFKIRLSQFVGYQSDKIDCYNEYLVIKEEIEKIKNCT
jgi:hypothetical protein